MSLLIGTVRIGTDGVVGLVSQQRTDIYDIANRRIRELMVELVGYDDDTAKGVAKDIHNDAIDAGWTLPPVSSGDGE